MTADYSATLKQYQSEFEAYLQHFFTDSVPQKKLYEAMRYSLLAGGKRIRPVLVLEFCRICGGDWRAALPFAAAIEMVHTYSLIHDDLPSMDNDDYRRGRLTNHKVYGEAQAILAGDALLTAAFDTIASAEATPEAVVAITRILASAAGEKGMVGGQILDIDGEGHVLSEEQVHTIHALKTGALISAACRMGAVAGGGSREQVQAAGLYADAIGLAFQIRDDMLDVLGDAEKLGKATGMDVNKSTFVTLYGLERCQQWIMEENKKALDALRCFRDTDFLEELTRMLAFRDH